MTLGAGVLRHRCLPPWLDLGDLGMGAVRPDLFLTSAAERQSADACGSQLRTGRLPSSSEPPNFGTSELRDLRTSRPPDFGTSGSRNLRKQRWRRWPKPTLLRPRTTRSSGCANANGGANYTRKLAFRYRSSGNPQSWTRLFGESSGPRGLPLGYAGRRPTSRRGRSSIGASAPSPMCQPNVARARVARRWAAARSIDSP